MVKALLPGRMSADRSHTLERREAEAMPLFLDIHKHVPGLTKDGVAGAHERDLAAQDKHDVKS